MFRKNPVRTDYTVINMKEYNQTRRKRLYYYVVAPVDTDDNALLQIFQDLDVGDRDEVTAWFYRFPDEIKDCLPYSVAMLSRKGKGQPITITR